MRKFSIILIKIKNNYVIALLFLICIFPIWSFAATPAVTIFPEKVIQGEPFRVTVENVSGKAAARKITFDGKSVGVLSYQRKPTALTGIDLNKKPGNYKIAVTFADGTKLEKIIQVGERKKLEAPFNIPEKLGGNTPVAANNLVSSLARENRALRSLKTFPKTLWVSAFNFPVPDPVVTDAYGHSRQTVSYSIAHKGTDFRAEEGTPVMSMNRGIVRLARTFRVFGKTVAIDHGLGLQTIYMHLSKIKVNEGELVKRGQVVGLSGQTGYALSPHLHVSVWLDKVSVDPMKFMALF